MKKKTLQFWNGRGHGKYDKYHISVCAYSRKQATELVMQACGITHGMSTELKTYYSKCWGDNMKNIVPEYPCVYVSPRFSDKPPVLVLEIKS